MSDVTIPFAVLDDRICTQRNALSNMMGIVRSVYLALAALDQVGATDDYDLKDHHQELRRALRVVYRMGDEIAAALDSDVLLKDRASQQASECVREALEAVDVLYQRAKEDSDDERRYGEADERLKEAQALVEWMPPADLSAYDGVTSPPGGSPAV